MEMDKQGFYHITHLSNLESIVRRGLYSHDQVRRRKIPASVVYDRDIVARRGYIPTDTRNSLHEYVNLYFNPRNPMMYRVKVYDLAVVQVNLGVLNRKGVWLADGNAAANATAIHPVETSKLAQLRQQVDRESWNDPDETIKKENGRKMMAECLVPVHVAPAMIEAVHVVDRRNADRVMQWLSGTGIRLIVNPHMFFSSGKKWEYVRNLPSLAAVSHPPSIPQNSVKVAVQQAGVSAKPSSDSPADKSVDAPANTPEPAAAIPSAVAPVSAPAPTRPGAQQTRQGEVSVPVHPATDSARTGRKGGKSKIWELLLVLFMILLVLASYEAFRRFRT